MGRDIFVDKAVTPDVTAGVMKHPLAQYLYENDQSVASFAKSVNTTRQTIYRIMDGTQRPSADMIAAIIDVTDLKFEDLYREATA